MFGCLVLASALVDLSWVDVLWMLQDQCASKVLAAGLVVGMFVMLGMQLRTGALLCAAVPFQGTFLIGLLSVVALGLSCALCTLQLQVFSCPSYIEELPCYILHHMHAFFIHCWAVDWQSLSYQHMHQLSFL